MSYLNMKNNFKTIDDAICGYIDDKSKRTTASRGYDYWSASSLGKCKRYQVMCRAGILTDGKVNYSWKNAALDGHAAHQWRQHALEKMGVLISKEIPIIDEELHFRGHYDLIVTLDGKLILGDIKTMNNRAYRSRQRLLGGYDPCHKRQLGAYFYFLKRDVYPDLHSARMYYVNKNTGEREEIELFFDDAYFKEIIDELKALNYYWDRQLLPKKEPGSFCHICQFEQMCKILRNRKDTPLKDAIQRSLPATTE